MEKMFRPSQTRNTMVWGLVLLAIIDIPLMLFFFLGSQGPMYFLVIMGVVLLLVDGLILSLSFLGKRMSYKLGEDDLTVNFGLSKRRIPYSSINNVQLSHTTLLLRYHLFHECNMLILHQLLILSDHLPMVQFFDNSLFHPKSHQLFY